MKTSIFLIIATAVLCTSFCLAQDQNVTIDISNQLAQPFPYGRACRAQVYEFAIRYGRESTANPVDNYYRVKGSGSSCTLEYVNSTPNASLKLEGEGITASDFSYKPATAYSFSYWFSNVKINKTGTVTVSWQERNIIPTNNCGYRSSTTTYTGTYPRVVSIPTPAKPTLTALKAVVKYPESTTITSSVCPNTLAGETEFPYNYYVTANKAWSFECGPDGKPDFRYNFSLTPPDSYFEFGSQYFYYKPGTVFRARCDDNGCVGEISDPVAVSIQQTTPNCPDTETNFIDNMMRTARKDYHHYTVETFVCNKADGNPNCTKQKVFELMKSSKRFAAPIASDFAEPLVFTDLGNLDTKVPLLGSDLVFKLDDTPVQNCVTINLPGYIGMAANLASLAAIPGAYHINRLATQQNPISNPVAQFIDEQSFAVTNYTKPNHILHPGKITRIVVEECDRIKVVTIGVGQHFFGDNLAGQFMGNLNIRSGRIIFHNIDERLIGEFNKLPR